MSRPRSPERRQAILDAATRVIAETGLGAATATIAREAGVSNGTLFVYFDTKTALLNALYLELKSGMGAAATVGIPADADVGEQLERVWMNWLAWATTYPEKRRALAQLTVSDELTEETHALASVAMTPLAVILRGAQSVGPMADQPLGFVLALVTALAESTIDALLAEPELAASHGRAGFDAMWRVLAGVSAPVA